ncbi:MAG TPA: multicopper oxidase domain-containing protein, partial [Longimicrobiales bacterium]
MGLLGAIASVIGGLALVLYFAGKLVAGAVGTARGLGVSAFVVSLVFVAFDPENLGVGAVAAVAGSGCAPGSLTGGPHMQGGVGLTRRDVLRLGAVAGLGLVVGGCPADRRNAARESAQAPEGTPDVTIRIAPVLVEVAPHRVISTIGYNGSVPAPIIRLREGRPVVVELINETDTPELVHWHGQFVPPEVDG